MSDGAGKTWAIRRAAVEDLPAIGDLFREAMDVDRPEDTWLWRYWAPQGPKAAEFVLDDGGDVVGHIGYQSMRMWISGDPGQAMCPGDTMVAVNHRGRGGFGELVQATMAEPQGHDVRIAFPKEHVSRMATHKGVGHVLGTLPQWIRWRTPEAMNRGRAKLLPSGAAAVVHGALRQLPRLRWPHEPPARRVDDIPTGVDELAEASRHYAAFVRVRDERYLRWRWLDQPRSPWELWEARSAEGRLSGFAVAAVADLPLGRTGRIVDLLAEDAASTASLLRTVASDAERRGAEIVTFEYADARSWSRRACYAAGLVERGQGPIVLELRVSPPAQAAPQGWKAWYLTFGDTDLV